MGLTHPGFNNSFKAILAGILQADPKPELPHHQEPTKAKLLALVF